MFRFRVKMNPAVVMSMQHDWHSWNNIISAGWEYGFFHAKERNNDRSLLFRVENGSILVQATHMPTRDFDTPEIKGNILVENYNPKPVGVIDFDVVMAVYSRLENNKLRFHNDYASRVGFFEKRLRSLGYADKILRVEPGKSFNFRFVKNLIGKPVDFELPACNFTVKLDVEDSANFLSLIARGISREKSSGCGLIVLREVE